MIGINEIKLDKNFYLSEFECHCCKAVRLHPLLLHQLIKLRLILEEPVYINSGYRCKKGNKLAGGTSNSYHLFGMAVDIKVKICSIADLAVYAEKVGFNGIGVYNNFLHLDVRTDKYHWSG